jgi:hypothetical protein
MMRGLLLGRFRVRVECLFSLLYDSIMPVMNAE